MPVLAAIPIIAAVGASAVAATSIAAAGLTLVTALEVVAAVGATLAAVGSITRDKTLTLVGGAIGLVGAVGGLAAGAGLLGAGASTDSLFGPSAAASTADAASSSAASAAGGFAEGLTPATSGTVGGAIDAGTFGDGAGLTTAEAASSGTVNFVAGLPPDQTDFTTLSTIGEKVPTAADGLTPDAMTTGLLNKPAIVADPTPSAETADLTAPPPAPPSPVDANGIAAAAGKPAAWQTPGQWAGGVNNADGTSTISGDSIFDKVLAFGDKNKTLVSGVLTVGGKLLEGMTSSLTPAQVNALQAQANANNAAAALTQQQTANLNMPKAVASSTPVTGTPGPLVPPSGAPGGPGIINQPRLAPVTGAVA